MNDDRPEYEDYDAVDKFIEGLESSWRGEDDEDLPCGDCDACEYQEECAADEAAGIPGLFDDPDEGPFLIFSVDKPEGGTQQEYDDFICTCTYQGELLFRRRSIFN